MTVSATNTQGLTSDGGGKFARFIRSLIGVHRAADKQAFAEFVDNKRYSRNRIEFVSLAVHDLTDHATIDLARINSSPFTGIAPRSHLRRTPRPTPCSRRSPT